MFSIRIRPIVRAGRHNLVAATTTLVVIAAPFGTVGAFDAARAPGSLDPSFGSNGIVRTAELDEVADVALQADGNIVVVGSAHGSPSKVGVVRYRPDGTLDTSFGGGIVLTPVGSQNATGQSVVVQADGTIIVAVRAEVGNAVRFALLRYLADGSLDPGFDGDGVMIGSAIGEFDSASALALQSDGMILVAGGTCDSSGCDIALARYQPNGALDLSFDGDGTVVTSLGGWTDWGSAVVVQSDGKIVVAGQAGVDFFVPRVGLLRYHPDGSPDTTFDGDGEVIASFEGGQDWTSSVALQRDGKVIVGGSSNGFFALARFNPDGTRDETFDGGPVGTVGDWGHIQSVSVQRDDKIVVAGFAGTGPATAVALARLDSNGDLDPGFGDGGEVVTSVDKGAQASSFAIQPDGKLVVVGLAADIERQDGLVLRYFGDSFCASDCDGNRAVTIGEVVQGINALMDPAAAAVCPSADVDGSQTVTVNEVVQGVCNLLYGCL